jgi:hypothetical protein
MKQYQVTCIRKSHFGGSHEHITHIGSNNLPAWVLSREEAIRRIDAKTEEFYTVDRSSGKKAFIGVVREAGKLPYLRTHADGKWNDNLLAQPECDTSCKILG